MSGGVPLDVSAMTGVAAPPRDNGELVFAAPWEGRVFALADNQNRAMSVPNHPFGGAA